MDIAFCLDNNYLQPCGVAICSVCENNKDIDLNFHIITSDLTKNNMESLKNITEKYKKNISFYFFNEELLKKFPAKEKNQPQQITLATYIRIFLGNILPTTIEKVLYLDCDLVCTDSLSSLWNTDLTNFAAAAVPDYDTDDIRHYNRLKYPQKYMYYNTGVFFINLKYWRENNVLEQLLQYFHNHRERILYHDQDLLNGVLHERILKLNAKYNVQISYWAKPEYNYSSWERWDELAEARMNPTIIHYISMYKPWFKECYYKPQEYYLKFRNLTEWKDVPLKHLFPLKTRITRWIRHRLEDIGILKHKEEHYDRHFESFRKDKFLR